MDYAMLIRALAVVAAVALLAGPRLVAAIKAARPALARKQQPEEVNSLADAHTVLEIASRLKAAGNAKGVELCQSLIDVMLRPEAKA
jgi:hypothetical protein